MPTPTFLNDSSLRLSTHVSPPQLTDNNAQCGILIKQLGQRMPTMAAKWIGKGCRIGRAERKCSCDIFSSHFSEFSGQFRQQCLLINCSSTIPSSHELISSISVSQHLFLCREMHVASLGPGRLPSGTDGSHAIRRRTSSLRPRPRLEYHSEADDIFEGMEDGRASAYERLQIIASHRGNSHAHITPDGVAMRRCQSLAVSIPCRQ
jgi:hypothetical protein